MAYHLYDNNRRHLAMSESLADLEAVATDIFTLEGRPFGYIRWTDASGQQKEVCVSPDSLAASTSKRAAEVQQVRNARQVTSQRKANRRAVQLTNAMVAVLLLYIAGEIASIVMQAPLSEIIAGP